MDNANPTRPGTIMGNKSRRRFGDRQPKLAFLITATFALGLVAGQLFGGGPARSDASSSLADHPAFESFQDAWNLVHDNYVLPGELDDAELLYGAASGMMEAVGDTGHSSFLDPANATAFKASLQGELIGIGVRLDFDDDFPVIVAPIKGSPAEAAGIERGDTIMEVDGVSTDRMTIAQITSSLRGDEGDEVMLKIGRPIDGSTFTVNLARARIRIEPVEWAFLPDGLFLIRLNEFSAGAGEHLRQALQVARNDGATGVVLDMRGNPGGLVAEALRVAGEFLPEGDVLYQHQDRAEEPLPVFIEDTGGLALDIPLVVLIDRGSASAAEIVAASLRDNGRAELVGEQTFGTGTVVSSYTLDDGSIAAIGTALWRTPEGELVRNVGVSPTIPVVLDPGVDPIEFESESVLSMEAIQATGDDQLTRAMGELSLVESPVVGVS
ncbi:S41 family peptidase [soil metagenome]